MKKVEGLGLLLSILLHLGVALAFWIGFLYATTPPKQPPSGAKFAVYFDNGDEVKGQVDATPKVATSNVDQRATDLAKNQPDDKVPNEVSKPVQSQHDVEGESQVTPPQTKTPEPKKVEPKPEPKKVEPKPEPKKVEPKPEPKKIEPKPEPKKIEPKPEPKKIEPEPEPKKIEPKPEPKNPQPPQKIKEPPKPKEAKVNLDKTQKEKATDTKNKEKATQTKKAKAPEIHKKTSVKQKNGTAKKGGKTKSRRGSPIAANRVLSRGQLNALKRQIINCWSPPSSLNRNNVNQYSATLVVEVNPDKTVKSVKVEAQKGGPALRQFVGSATRAIKRCGHAPSKLVLPDGKYADWHLIYFDFSAKEMFSLQ